MTYTQTIWNKLRKDYGEWIFGHEGLIDLLFIAYFARGHVLIEGPPGTGKTVTAKLLSRFLSKAFKRVQFTSDMLPADILGSHIYVPDKQEFKFIPGPVFTDFLLADEINRTPPRTQSALLEAMEERQVTIDGELFKLKNDFFVVATQNPYDYEGTFPLPEVQLDRFLFKIVLNHADLSTERKILEQVVLDLIPPPFERFEALTFDREQVEKEIGTVKVEGSLFEYISKLLAATRHHSMFSSGASIRGGIALVRTSRIRALCEGRNYVILDDIKLLATPILRHRIRLNPEAEIAQVSEADLIQEILKKIEFPK